MINIGCLNQWQLFSKKKSNCYLNSSLQNDLIIFVDLSSNRFANVLLTANIFLSSISLYQNGF